MTKNIIESNKGIHEFFWKHPAIAGSLLIIFMSAVGTLYSWYLYFQFDLNIFNYAEPNDLFLAAFRGEVSVLLAIFTLIYAIGSLIFASHEFQTDTKGGLKVLTFIIITGIIMSAVGGAYVTKKTIEKDTSFHFTVNLRSGDKYENLSAIGNVDNYRFYLSKDGTIHIFTVPNIIYITKELNNG